MIVKVEIENYQSHEKTLLDLVPGVNVIIGESDAGKSAIFRAINWAASNRPLGDIFRSEWGGDTKIVIHTSEGDVIERRRTASKNEYIVNGKPLTAFGTETPEEVIDVLRMDAANIQAQSDPPFLLSVSPGEAARMLNRAASLEDIDRTIAGLKRAHSRIESKSVHYKEQLNDLLKEMEKYKDIPTLEDKMKAVEELEEQRAIRAKRKSEIMDLIEKIRAAGRELEKTKNVPEMLKKLHSLEKEVPKLDARKKALHAVEGIISRMENLSRILESKGMKNTDRAESILRDAEGQMVQLIEKSERIGSVERTIMAIKRKARSVSNATAEMLRIQSEYDSLAEELGACPLCGNTL